MSRVEDPYSNMAPVALSGYSAKRRRDSEHFNVGQVHSTQSQPALLALAIVESLVRPSDVKRLAG